MLYKTISSGVSMSKAKEAVRRYLNIIDTGDPSRMDHKDQTTPKSSFPKTTLNEVASCLPVSGKAKKLQEMDAAIRKGSRSRKRKL